MSEDLDLLVDLLDLETIEVNIFRGLSPDEDRQRVFGGQVAAQSLMAAGRTIGPDRRPHSLHAYFLRPGDPNAPILYEVDRIRDGSSFTTRRVVAIQHGRAIFNLSTSFHVEETGLSHQFPMPEAPDPESLPSLADQLEPYRDALEGWFERPHPIDQRFIGGLPFSPNASHEPTQRLWIRADGTLPDDPLLHACIATYASDMSLFDSMLAPHQVKWDDVNFMGASLDHCMWF
ncbi:MAG: acyl-CoA thioesterase II, partial [Acidimicrobiales bacterium]